MEKEKQASVAACLIGIIALALLVVRSGPIWYTLTWFFNSSPDSVSARTVPKPVASANSAVSWPMNVPNLPEGKVAEINAYTGASGQACAVPPNLGFWPKCAKVGGGQENCDVRPVGKVCIHYECSSFGDYDIPIEFQDKHGVWALAYIIHCHAAATSVTICTAGQPCQAVGLPP